ncbi:MAG: acyltransferase family protein [Armatimonadota bacterium]|nr:acyltransferase [bacterium]
MAVIKYRPAIDGLRAVAVLSVFIFHLNNKWMPGGFVGVDVFFAVSGFLITSIIYGECLQHQFSLAKFYQRRIARIFPAFLTVAFATLVTAFFAYIPQDFASCGISFAAAAFSVANLKYMLQGNYFTISPDAYPFLHYWSLSVEEQFYMIFPLAILLLHRFARRALVPILSLFLIISLAASVLLTQSRPVWAFYLLPTRGWELLAGALLAIVSSSVDRNVRARLWDALALAGLAMIFTSVFVIREGAGFPGWIAMLPVLGSILVIGPNSGSNGIVEGLLARPVMVFIGKFSYSLYLWHWPVFSFVDYTWYEASDWQRLSLKVGLSVVAAITCYKLIENPSRKFLNQPTKRALAFTALPIMLAVFAAVGLQIRNTYYLNCTGTSAADGGIVIGAKRTAGSIMLIGDSNGSMYGTALRKLSDDLQYKLTVLSVTGGDTLPSSNGKHDKLWLDSLAAVRNGKPTLVVFVCNWTNKLSTDKSRLRVAIKALSPHTRQIVMMTTPPVGISREAIRNGAKPPFFEDAKLRNKRLEMNRFVESLRSGKVTVLDVESLFHSRDGGIRWKDDKNCFLYQDCEHLSYYGAMLVMPDLRRAIKSKNLIAQPYKAEALEESQRYTQDKQSQMGQWFPV